MSVLAVFQLVALILGAMLCGALVVADLRERRLPDVLNAGLAALGLIFHALSDPPSATWAEILAGGGFGAGFFLAMRLLFLRLRGVEALGLGDVKFMAAAGLWVGIWGIAPLILIAALATLLVVVLRHGRDIADPALRQRRIPFGPGLAFALVVVVALQLLGVAFV